MSSAHAHLLESAVAKMLRSHLGLQVHPAKSEELAPSLSSVAPGLGSNLEKYTPGNKRVSGYRFRYQLTCPLYTGVFLGNALQLFFYTLTQKQLTCLSSCNWGPWISTLIWDMLAIFW